MSVRRTLTVCALSAAALAAGCGDDGPTRQEFAREADRACADIERQFQDIGRADPDTPAELIPVVQRSRDLLRQARRRLQEIERPGGDDGEKAEAFVNAL